MVLGMRACASERKPRHGYSTCALVRTGERQAEADRALVRYFEIRSRQTQAARELIKQLQDSVLNIEMPTLSHSLAAVRQSRSRP
jgi:hypothetical protein